MPPTPVEQLAGYHELSVLVHWMIPAVGVIISFASFLGVFAARKAVAQLEFDWLRKVVRLGHAESAKAVQKYYDRVIADNELFLPQLTGGGAKHAHVLGFLPPFLTPLIFVCIWIAAWWFNRPHPWF